MGLDLITLSKAKRYTKETIEDVGCAENVIESIKVNGVEQTVDANKSVNITIPSVPEEYVTETELTDKGYLTEHQDLSEYAKTVDVVLKENGKSLVSDTDIAQITTNKTAIETLNGTGESSVNKKVAIGIAKVVSNAPKDFDTLKEVADWIANDTSGAAKMQNDIATLNGDETKEGSVKKQIKDSLVDYVKTTDVNAELDKKVNTTDIIDNLTSTDTDKPVSANQAKILDNKIEKNLNDSQISVIATEKSPTVDTVDAPVISFKLEGYTFQDGIPTPDNPVEIQGYGSKEIDYDGQFYQGGIKGDNNNYFSSADFVYSDYIELPIAKYGGWEIKIDTGNSSDMINILFYDKDYKFLYSAPTQTNDETGEREPTMGQSPLRKFCANDCYFFRFNINRVGITPNTVGNVVVRPYGGIRVQSCSEIDLTETILVGKRLTSSAYWGVIDNGDEVHIQPLKTQGANIVKIITDNPDNQINGKLAISDYDLNYYSKDKIGNGEMTLYNKRNANSDYDPLLSSFLYFSITRPGITPDNVGKIKVQLINDVRIPLWSLPLYEGDYVQLNSDGTGFIHKEWETETFVGSEYGENWMYIHDDKTNLETAYIQLAGKNGVNIVSYQIPYGNIDANITCNRFRWCNGELKENTFGYWNTGVFQINLPKGTFTDVATVKAWIKNHPITILYRLKEPVTIKLGLPDTLYSNLMMYTPDQNYYGLKEMQRLKSFNGKTTFSTDGRAKFTIECYKNNDSGRINAGYRNLLDKCIKKA